MIALNLKPSARQLRVFGAGALVLFGLLGWWMSAHAHPNWALACWILGGLGGLGAALAPRLALPLYIALTLAAFPIGVALSYLMLAVMWYVVIGFVALCFRIVGRDPLQRRRLPGASSYWQPYPRTDDRERYFRQF
jgi:hypothetical protein